MRGVAAEAVTTRANVTVTTSVGSSVELHGAPVYEMLIDEVGKVYVYVRCWLGR